MPNAARPVEMMHRSPVSDTMHYGTPAACQISACIAVREMTAVRHCLHCDAKLDREAGLWVDALSGDAGGTYDHCPVNPTKQHVPAA